MSTFHFPEGQSRMGMYSDLVFLLSTRWHVTLKENTKYKRNTIKDEPKYYKRTNAQRLKVKVKHGQMMSFTVRYEYQRVGLLPVTCNVHLSSIYASGN